MVLETQEAAELKFQTEASSLRENIQSLENALAEKEKELNENVSKAEELENLLDARNSENDLKEAQVSDLKTSAEDLERQLKEKDDKVDELCEQLGKIEGTTSVLKRRNKLHEEQYSEYMISLTSKDKKLEEIEKSLDQKMKLNEDLQAQVKKFESEANGMMEKLSSQSALDANLQEKISSLEATVEMYEMMAEKSDADTDQKMRILEEKLKEARRLYAKTAQELEMSRADQEEVEGEFERAKYGNMQESEQSTALRNDLFETKKVLSQTKLTADEALIKINELKADNERLQSVDTTSSSAIISQSPDAARVRVFGSITDEDDGDVDITTTPSSRRGQIESDAILRYVARRYLQNGASTTHR
jgi:hypothetical protein